MILDIEITLKLGFYLNFFSVLYKTHSNIRILLKNLFEISYHPQRNIRVN